jgi:hypothetical protein
VEAGAGMAMRMGMGGMIRVETTGIVETETKIETKIEIEVEMETKAEIVVRAETIETIENIETELAEIIKVMIRIAPKIDIY